MTTSTQPYRQPTVRRPRRRRVGRTLLVLALVLVVLVVVADRVGARAASGELRGRVADELATRQVSYASLDVGIGGVPFLTQVASSEFERIAIDLTQVALATGDGRTADLPRLHVVATGVHADVVQAYQGTGTVTADRVSGTAVVAYRTLSDQIDLSQYEFAGVHLSDISFTESGGALRAQVHVQALGFSAPVEAAAQVEVVAGHIEIRLRDARAIGVPMPQLVLDPLSDLANHVLVANLPTLPFGLVLDRFDVVGDGVSVTVAGQNVQLAGSGGTTG